MAKHLLIVVTDVYRGETGAIAFSNVEDVDTEICKFEFMVGRGGNSSQWHIGVNNQCSYMTSYEYSGENKNLVFIKFDAKTVSVSHVLALVNAVGDIENLNSVDISDRLIDYLSCSCVEIIR